MLLIRCTLMPVAYAENFMGEVWFKVIWWLFVFGVHCLWRHNLTSCPCFQTNVLAKFVDIVCIFFYIHSHYICRCTGYELSALQVTLSGKNKLNVTTQQFITAKITGYALKQGNETHSSLRQSNLQLQNQAALRSLIRAIEHWRCAAGLAGAHPGLQDRILLKQIKYARKCLLFVMFGSPQVLNQGGESPLRKVFAPTGKMCLTILKLLHIV